MCRKLASSVLVVSLMGLAGRVSAADLYVSEGSTVTVTTNQTYGKIDVYGTLIIESSATVAATGASGKSGVRGCCAEIIVNGGSLDINSRFDTDGDGEPGARITMNGGFFEADDLKLPDERGPVTVELNGGIFHAVGHQPYLNRNFKVIVGGGVYRVDGDVEGEGDADPRTWLTYEPPALLPADGYSVDAIVIEYVAGGGYTEVRTDTTPRVQFETASSGAFESVSPAELTVVLTNGEAGQTYTVDYAATGGTAEGNGVDYTLTPGPLTFNPGETSKTIDMTISNDDTDEEDETVEVTLTGVSGGDAILGQKVQHTYTIIDPRPRVAFETAASSGREDVSPVDIEVGLSWAASGTVTVDYGVTGGTAEGNGVDYTLLGNGTLTFNQGDTSEIISIAVVDDELEEENETIELALSNLTGGARLGDCTQYAYTIFENVFPSFADADSVGLWLFDEPDYPHTTLTDASESEKADLCLMDGGNMAAGKFGRALLVTGSDYAVSYAGFAGKVPEEELREPDGTPSGLWGPTEGSGPLLNGLAGSTWTIELWLNLSSSGSGISIIDMGQAYEPGLSLILNSSSFELTNYYAGVRATCPTGLSTGVWQHVAFTWDGSTASHFVDGVEQSAATVSSVSVQPVPDLQVPSDREHESRGFESMTYEQRRQNRFNFAVGTDRHASGALDGMVDEMRISRVVRYTANFTPESFSRNYGPGAPPPSVADGPPLLFDPGPVSVPLDIGGRKHIFIDDAVIDTMSGLQITLNQPYGKQEIIKDFSIESSAWRPSVFDVNGVVYLAIPEGYGSAHGTTFLATSPDGLNFTMQGEMITDIPFYGSFFRDLNPNVRAEEQYKVNAFVANRGMYFYVSPDGVNWRRNETIQLPLRSGGEGECFWDDQQGDYASFIKRDSSFDDPECADAAGRVAPGFWSDEILKAWPFFHMETPYFEGYPFPSVTCEGPVIFDVTAASQVYRTRAIKYPWAPDVYLAFVWRYPGDDGPRHVDLGISRNGEDWSFFGTNWYIPLGSAEEELSLYGLIRRGDEIWQYVDEGGAHGGSAPRYYYRYRQRLDGFVSLDAGGSTGTATTLPLVFSGSELALNVAATGPAKVGILDEFGVPIPGFGVGDCDPIQADFIEYVVTWNGESDISALSGGVVRLQFEMQNTKLYAFQFGSFVRPGFARAPSPADGAQDVLPDAILSWLPGSYAASQDVYFGTDYSDVNEANTTETRDVYAGSQSVGDTNYAPAGNLEYEQAYYWRIDSVNETTIWQGDVWSFTVCRGRASDPSPADGTTDMPLQVQLSWSPGYVAASHDVYLGTSWIAVSEANSSSDEYKTTQSIGNETYDACGLSLAGTYYWRIDEVNPGYEDVKGDVWSFSTIQYRTVDDMESYCEGPVCENQIYDTWKDYWTNGTGALVTLGTSPGEPVHGGTQSMSFEYENDPMYKSYSETSREFADPCNWAGPGFEVLALYFYGSPGNALEEMYLGLEDTTGANSVASYSDDGHDINDIKVSEWHEWFLDLGHFGGGVNLTDVNRIRLGFGDPENPVPGGAGIVYFDDLAVYKRICRPGSTAAADFTKDCRVDYLDLRTMAAEWLSAGTYTDLIDDENVDFKDYTALADDWLKEFLWP